MASGVGQVEEERRTGNEERAGVGVDAVEAKLGNLRIVKYATFIILGNGSSA